MSDVPEVLARGVAASVASEPGSGDGSLPADLGPEPEQGGSNCHSLRSGSSTAGQQTGSLHSPVRGHRVSVFLDDHEFRDLVFRAGGRRRVGEYMRRLVAGTPLFQVPPTNSQQWSELGRLAGNLHRAVLHLQSCPGDHSDLAKAIGELRRELAEVRASLIGAQK